MPGAFNRWSGRVAAKGLAYWFYVAVLIALGVFLGILLQKNKTYLVATRYSMYQWFVEKIPGEPTVNDVYLVIIDDEEYWKGELGRRVPIKRDYLAELVHAIAMKNPAAIALDFDLRSPVPSGSPVEHPDYKAETDLLLETVKETASRCPIVLPKTVALADDGSFVKESDIYDEFDWGSAKQNVRFGYIALDEDMRKVSVRRAIRNSDAQDSFVQAIVRAAKPPALRTIQAFEGQTSLPYARYLPKNSFTWISSGAVLQGNPNSEKLAHAIVIVGGAWSQSVYGRSQKTDEYLTPVGLLPGVFIHANHVEAIITGRVYRSLSETFVHVVEVLFSLLVAVLIAIGRFWWHKLGAVILPLLFLVALNYLLLVNFGYYFDAIVPAIMISGHGLYEHFRKPNV